MTFPDTPLLQKIEIFAGSWIDISTYGQNRDGTTIKRGKADEQASISPTTCAISINNRDGRFSPRNPSSPYYGSIGRNTPLRVSLPQLDGKTYLDLGQNTGTAVGTSYVTTPDAATLDVVGDIDIRFHADLENWYAPINFVSKYTATGNQRSFLFSSNVDGIIRLRWSTDGSTVVGPIDSTAPVPVKSGPLAVRVVLDVNNGAAGNTVTFYTSDSVTGTFTQLGNPVVTAGITSIFSSTAPVRVAVNPDTGLNQNVVRGKVFKAQIMNGIAGTIVANPDFTIQTAGAASFVDTAVVPKTWTPVGTAIISDRDWRFTGEVSAWPQKWDQSGSDIWTEIEGGGIFRRLGQGASPVQSTLRKYEASKSTLVAYWPAEDGENATTIASALSSGKSMTINGSPDMASFTDFDCSAPIPTMNNASFNGVVKSYTSTGDVRFQFLLAIPAGGTTNNAIIARFKAGGTLPRYDIYYQTGGQLGFKIYDDSDALVRDSTTVAFGADGDLQLITLTCDTSGGNVISSLAYYSLGTAIVAGVGPFSDAGTVTSAQSIQINPNKTLDDVAMGHFAVFKDATIDTVVRAVNAFDGELAIDRMQRLTTENGIAFQSLGSDVDCVYVGPQRTLTLLELMVECADADQGILYEPRDQYGIAYRSRQTLNHQAATASPSYTLNQLASLEPVEDDQSTRNDVTVTRRKGGSSRQQLLTGALSVSAPPSGVGTYDVGVTLNLYADSQTDDTAAWLLAQGTIDEPRYPTIDFDYTSPSTRNDSALVLALSALDVGDRLVVVAPEHCGSPENISQIVQGYTEFLNNFERRVSVNCSPARVYDAVGVYAAATVSGGGQSKYSSDGSTLNGAHNSTTTSLSVATPSGPLWTTDSAQMPINMIVAGERVTVTAISGTSSPQTFTVTRSVNGIIKSQASGATIALLTPAKYGY